MWQTPQGHIERITPVAFDEKAARQRNPADWQRYDFACDAIRGKSVLDCACGAGYGTQLLSRAGARAVGVDISADAIAWAKKEFGSPSIEFRQASAGSLPVKDGEFDSVVSFETIEHVEPESASKFVADLARALKPGGTLILSTPLTWGAARLHPANPFHLREYEPEELERLIAPHFEIDRRLGQHSGSSRRFADLKQTVGLGALLRAGVHRSIPEFVKRPLRQAVLRGADEKQGSWITDDRWREAAVQIIVARKR